MATAELSFEDLEVFYAEQLEHARTYPLAEAIPGLQRTAARLVQDIFRWTENVTRVSYLCDQVFPPGVHRDPTHELIVLLADAERGLRFYIQAHSQTLAMMRELSTPREPCEMV